LWIFLNLNFHLNSLYFGHFINLCRNYCSASVENGECCLIPAKPGRSFSSGAVLCLEGVGREQPRKMRESKRPKPYGELPFVTHNPSLRRSYEPFFLSSWRMIGSAIPKINARRIADSHSMTPFPWTAKL